MSPPPQQVADFELSSRGRWFIFQKGRGEPLQTEEPGEPVRCLHQKDALCPPQLQPPPLGTCVTTPTYKLIRDHVRERGLLLGEKLTGAEQGILRSKSESSSLWAKRLVPIFTPRSRQWAPPPPPAAPLRDPHRGPLTTWPAPVGRADPSLPGAGETPQPSPGQPPAQNHVPTG